MQEYVTRVERLSDGSLCTTLFGGGRRVYQEPVRTLRHGKRRAYDLLCTAVDIDWDADPSVSSAVLGQGPHSPGPSVHRTLTHRFSAPTGFISKRETRDDFHRS